jgi:Flp pilus assembly protein TadG
MELTQSRNTNPDHAMRTEPWKRLHRGLRRLAKLPADSGGNLLVFTTLTIASLIGVTGLALDLQRVMALNSELQNAADASALAGAKELNRLKSAMSRAQLAATGNAVGLKNAVVNDQRFASTGLADVQITSVRFFKTLGGAALDAADPDNDGLAQFIEVTTASSSVLNRFLQLVGGPNTYATSAVAVAGNTLVACKVTPLMMCDPSTNGGTFNPKVGQQFILLDQGDWQQPGNFGLLENALIQGSQSNGAPAVVNIMASPQPNICWVSELQPQTGGMAGPVADAINVRFDMYSNGWKADTVAAWYPAPKPIRGIPPKNATKDPCQLQTNPDYTTGPQPLPRDLCFTAIDGGAADSSQCDGTVAGLKTGAALAGNGTWWSRAEKYFQSNYGVSAPAALAGKTRYQLWQMEVTGAILNYITPTKTPPDFSAGSCYQETTGKAPPVDLSRRIIYVAIVDCKNNPFNGSSGQPIATTKYAEFFITEPVINPDSRIFAEYIGMAEVNDSSGVLNELIQLYR